MIRHFKVIFVCCSLLSSIYAIQLPSSPCPNVFAYEGDADSDKWHGVITFSSNIELVGMNYKVELDRPSQLLVSWDGDVRTTDNTNFNVFDPYHTQRAGEIVKARIMVKFNPSNGIPGIMRIVINGNTMCSRDGNFGSGSGVGLSGGGSDRPDPSFNEGDDSGSDVSNNRGPSPSNYGGNSPNYNENNPNYESRPNSNRPSYGSSEPNYNSGSSNFNPNRQVPSYVNSGTTSSPVYVVNPSNTAGNSNSAGSYVPSSNANRYNGDGASYSGQSNSNDLEFANGNRPQWSDTSSSTNYNNNNNNNNNRNTSFQSGGFAISQSNGASSELNPNGGPIVTTLTLPNSGVTNKTNIDQIVQIIKNQLEQQQISSSPNKTLIVAVVNPAANSAASHVNSSGSSTSTDSGVIYRTTTASTPVTAKAKIVASTAKSSSSNGHNSSRSRD